MNLQLDFCSTLLESYGFEWKGVRLTSKYEFTTRFTLRYVGIVWIEWKSAGCDAKKILQ